MTSHPSPSRTDRLRLAMLALHPRRLRKLRSDYSERALLTAIGSGQVRVPDVAREVLDATDAELWSLVSGLDVLMAGEAEYPSQLAELPDAPDVLFVRGSIPVEPIVGIVGTRKCTGYGRRIAQALGRALAAAGWPVVSGLARGIDGAAHKGSIETGIGLAVLGSGIDQIYPREHERLAHDLIDGGGALVSEYPPGIRPDGWRFPPRNRIISGLSSAIVVAEAPVKGGSMITATHALEHGRPLLAVPGDIDRETSRGCNLLIRDGAFPVLDVDDLITGLSFLLGPPPNETSRVDLMVVAEAVGKGCFFDDLVERLACPPSEALALVSQAEAAGQISFENGWIARR